MARTLDQVLAELGSTFDPQVENYRKRQEAIPGQIAEEEKGLDAKKEAAFGRILGGARQRGLGFSGIPLAEQAGYTGTEYLPALARLKQSGREQAMSLEDAVLGIQERRRTLGTQIYEGELSREMEQQKMAEQRRQFDLQLAAQERQAAAARAAASSGGFSLGGGGATAAAPASATMGFKNGKSGAGGFAFKSANGQNISAAAYAQAKGVPIANVLAEMARAGDKYAGAVYNQLKANQGLLNDPAYLNNIKRQYSALFWGT